MNVSVKTARRLWDLYPLFSEMEQEERQVANVWRSIIDRYGESQAIIEELEESRKRMAMFRELRLEIGKVLDQMPAAMQKVIQLRYMMDGRSPTYYEIGQKMGYCEVYIKTMEREACRRLAASLSSMQSPAVVEYIQQLEDRRA